MELLKREAKAFAFYILILAVFLLLINAKIAALKTEINTVVAEQCLSGSNNTALEKYNDQLQAQIQDAQAYGDTVRVKRLTADLIPVTKQDCSKPLLP